MTTTMSFHYKHCYKVLLPGLLTLLSVLYALTDSALASSPQRVVSTNLCTDQLLLMLAAPTQIASVSALSLEPASSYMAKSAEQYPVNHARIEELLRFKPDLILASPYNSPSMVTFMRKLGYRVELIKPANTIDDIETNIQQIAIQLGKKNKGDALVRTMRQQLAAIKIQPQRKRPGGLFYQPRGYTSGRGTLQDEALRRSGWRNLASEAGIRGYQHIDLETLLRLRPVHIFTSAYAAGTDSLAQRLLYHPALRHLTAGTPITNIDYKYWICGGPMITQAIRLLAKARPVQ
ncbi:MAG TPA: cobalamin ABC transporter substrate-binding protein [Gammaproteobacteria bacterium]|nr:cobalamin ABC transporter substrate-binding protein [Gammaproteobacteria bacterium]